MEVKKSRRIFMSKKRFGIVIAMLLTACLVLCACNNGKLPSKGEFQKWGLDGFNANVKGSLDLAEATNDGMFG